MNRSLKYMRAIAVVTLVLSLALPVLGAETPPAQGARGARGGGAAPAGERRGRGETPVDPEAEARMQALGSRGVGIHDPSTINKCGDTYWIFYTGGGTPSYSSKDLVTWERGPSVFAGRQAPAWQAEVRAEQSRHRLLGAGCHLSQRQVPAVLLDIRLRQPDLSHRRHDQHDARPERSCLRMDRTEVRDPRRIPIPTPTAISTPSTRASSPIRKAACGCPSVRSGAASC